MARFEPVNLSLADWGKTLATFPDRIVFQTPAWIAFLAETQRARPVFAALKDGNDTLGFFSGLVVRKFGLKILGSSFRGWSTPYMGFNLRAGVPRRLAAEAIADYALKELGCLHFEVVDARLALDDIQNLGLAHHMNATMEIDLTQTEDELLNHMTKSCRWTVRKAERNGIVIEEAGDEAFADEYSEQLQDVFAKQGLVPHFGADRVRSLIRHMLPSGNLLMLRARNPEGHCIATGLYPGLHQNAYYWGGASWRQYQKLYPNELLHWYAVRYWKKRGAHSYNMVGTMEFKQKFGGAQTAVPVISQSKYRAISFLRTAAPQVLRTASRVAWKLKTLGKGKPEAAAAPESSEPQG